MKYFLALTLFFLTCSCGLAKTTSSKSSVTNSSNSSNSSNATNSGDPAYRIRVLNSTATADETSFPSASSSWEVTYTFTTPPLPAPGSWNLKGWSDFYVWGDVDFDAYGSSGSYPLSNYLYNQVAPELILGYGLDESSAAFVPSWHNHHSWVAQAQYFWQSAQGTNYAIVGELLPTNPGETVTTNIYYDSLSGAITASISVPAGKSVVVIPRPFPNDKEQSFSSWRDFFTKAQAATPGHALLARPEAQVETHYVETSTLCSILPFKLNKFSLPKVAGAKAPAFTTKSYGQFTCENPLTALNL